MHKSYYELYKSLDGFKESGTNQYVALCPFHDDTNPSLSINTEDGLYYCHSCNATGNAYQFAQYKGIPNPHMYINDDNNNTYKYTPVNLSVKTGNNCVLKPNPMDRRKNHASHREYLEKEMEVFKSNLKNNLDKIPDIWDKSRIDEFGLGLQTNGEWVFGYYDADGNIIGFKRHKSISNKGFKCQWYVGNKIPSFKHDLPLYICEGEKDVITLLSIEYQAISSSNGCKNIPKDKYGKFDINWMREFKEIYICYDNDDAGIKGANKLAKELLRIVPKVSIIQWDESLPDKFDVYDAFMKQSNAQDFYDAVKKSIENKRSNTIGGLKLITSVEADSMDVIPTRQIIDNLMPENSQIILGGTTGAGKSYFALQMGMSLANDEDEFLGFRININGLKVLYCDTECGEKVLVSRYKSIKKNFDWNEQGRFALLPKTSNTDNIYDDLAQQIEAFQPDIVIIDCLYNTTDGADISKNHHISPVLNRITELKKEYDITIIAVHHMNKGNHELGLTKDRMSGGSALQNWCEHIVLLTETNESGTRLMKIDKSRHIDYPRCYYELGWDASNSKFENNGVSNNWKNLMITHTKKNSWDKVLRDLSDEFNKSEFKTIVESIMGHSERTATNWLNDMLKCGVIGKVKHGIYKKKLKVIKGEE